MGINLHIWQIRTIDEPANRHVIPNRSYTVLTALADSQTLEPPFVLDWRDTGRFVVDGLGWVDLVFDAPC